TIQPNSTASGIKMPLFNNFVFSTLNKVLVYNYYKGVEIAEHSSLDNLFIDGCYYGLWVNSSYHSIHGNRVCIARSVKNIGLTATTPV
ncbi:hypothetical protein MZB85_28635, partial [Klebsiella pneumoniae]|uniref:hypothetical protein n=1 Tax=Klebsiella pneumoniae TaxID=573 RepID=UPI0020D194D9